MDSSSSTPSLEVRRRPQLMVVLSSFVLLSVLGSQTHGHGSGGDARYPYPKAYDTAELNRSSFPRGFIFGASSSSYQVSRYIPSSYYSFGEVSRSCHYGTCYYQVIIRVHALWGEGMELVTSKGRYRAAHSRLLKFEYRFTIMQNKESLIRDNLVIYFINYNYTSDIHFYALF